MNGLGSSGMSSRSREGKIGITGATGRLGRIVVEKLMREVSAEDVVALVRSPGRAADLGVEAREFDYDEPAALAPALDGVATLLLISASEVGERARQHHNVIEAAKEAGVKRVVYTSLLHADTSPIDLAAEHLATEGEVKASGIPFTILRNGWYTENYADSVPAALEHGVLVGSAGEGRIASATREDFADAAVAVLTREEDAAAGRTYELSGDVGWTLTDLAAELSRQTGESILYRDQPEPEYAKALEESGLPRDVARRVAGWDVAASQGALFDGGRQLSTLIGRPTTPMADTVAETLERSAARR